MYAGTCVGGACSTDGQADVVAGDHHRGCSDGDAIACGVAHSQSEHL